jgi:hypothetical protein
VNDKVFEWLLAERKLLAKPKQIFFLLLSNGNAGSNAGMDKQQIPAAEREIPETAWRCYIGHRVDRSSGSPLLAAVEAFIENLVGRRDELLNEVLFGSLAHTREILTLWKGDYNTMASATLGGLRQGTLRRASSSGADWVFLLANSII